MLHFNNIPDSKYVFTHEYGNKTITTTIINENLDEIITAFQSFLLACGFTIDGTLDIVNIDSDTD